MEETMPNEKLSPEGEVIAAYGAANRGVSGAPQLLRRE